MCVALGVGESVGRAVSVFVPDLDTVANGGVGWSVRVGGGAGDGLATGLEIKPVTAGTVSGSPATAGPTPQPVRMPSDTTSNRVAVRTGLAPLCRLSTAAADHSWDLFTLLGSPYRSVFLKRAQSSDLDVHTVAGRFDSTLPTFRQFSTITLSRQKRCKGHLDLTTETSRLDKPPKTRYNPVNVI